MATNYPVVVAPDSLPAATCSEVTATNWRQCILCQNESDEHLVQPGGRQNSSTSGYETLAHNLIAFNSLDTLPLNINISRLDDGSGVQHTLEINKAGWHKSCSLLFCNMKLERVKKRVLNKQSKEQNHSPAKTRRSFGPPLPCTYSTKPACLFCEETDGHLHRAATASIDATVRHCATELRDAKLLCKLAAGDMVAIDAMYHLPCFTKLKNRMRDLKASYQRDIESKVTTEVLVLGELVRYIEDCRSSDDMVPVFKLSALVKKYTTRLAEMEESEIEKGRVNSTRLKEKLLSQIPQLRAEPHGRDVLLIFDADVGGAIKHATTVDENSEARTLLRAAQIVRKRIFEHKYTFDGSFPEDCERRSIPPALNTLMRMILDCPTIEDQSESNADSTKEHIAIVLAQLVQFNVIKRCRNSTSMRHNKERETPLPIYLSMLIHAKTRKRTLVDTLYNLGLCVSYDRLMSMSTDLANTVCALYHTEEVVCPPQLKRSLFTCGAADNIDHNPSSTTAKDSFHGTAISLMQFPTTNNQGEDRDLCRLNFDVPNHNAITPLPAFYTMVPPATSANVAIVPARSGHFMPDPSIVSADKQKEYEWLAGVQSIPTKPRVEDGDNLTWAAFHASRQHSTSVGEVSNIALLPLFREKAHSTSTIIHAINIIKKATHHVNPGQTPVMVVDQPLYALSKQIQWTWPEFGEDKLLVMMGGLHIEMNLLKMLGDFLRGSGWTAAIERAELTTSGRADAILSGSPVTRCRYAHQVTVASLTILVQRSYQQYVADTRGVHQSFESWHARQCAEKPHFKFWAMVMELQLTFLQFLRSVRERNFASYVLSLKILAPWLFAFNHTNYARWLPVHISDMTNLSTRHPDVHEEFTMGHFAVQKTSNAFSAMAIDQCHEQLNDLIKGDGGAVGLTESPQALERWMIAGPEISRLIQEFGKSYQTPTEKHASRHHEQHVGIQQSFSKDVKSLVKSLEDMGNPKKKKVPTATLR